MKTFLVVMLVLHIIGIFVKGRDLSAAYPRVRPINRAEDLVGLMIQVGMLAWIINLLDLL